jgi:hypothetical protein
VSKDSAEKDESARAARAADGSFAIVYLPQGNPVSIKLDVLPAKELNAWWFNPRQNTAQLIGKLHSGTDHEFNPPHHGRNNDWVLVLDDAAASKLPRIGNAY